MSKQNKILNLEEDDLQRAKYYELNGIVMVPNADVSVKEFQDLFLDFVESHGWFYGGGINISYTDKENDKSKLNGDGQTK